MKDSQSINEWTGFRWHKASVQDERRIHLYGVETWSLEQNQ